MRLLQIILLAMATTSALKAEDKILRIYHDADRSIHIESAQSIERGIKTALSEIGSTIQGYKIEFIPLDHRGNVLRSKINFKKYLKDPKALVIFSGINSPPLVINRSFINDNKALTLVPWAAAGPITRHPSRENWIFRLSVDDSRAGFSLVKEAVENQKCKNPHLLLESTPWGDSNLSTISKALNARGITSYGMTRFGINLKKSGADILIRRIQQTKTDCVLMVGNSMEGANITKSMSQLPKTARIPIISHWGITAGKFHDVISNKQLNKVKLNFIQSCFSFNSKPLSDKGKKVFEQAKNLFPDHISKTADIKSPVGFIHAYDLTKILIQALSQVTLTENMADNKNAVRLALENIQKPVQGLVKTYGRPFQSFDAKKAPNAHEALNPENYCMGQFGPNHEIILTK